MVMSAPSAPPATTPTSPTLTDGRIAVVRRHDSAIATPPATSASAAASANQAGLAHHGQCGGAGAWMLQCAVSASALQPQWKTRLQNGWAPTIANAETIAGAHHRELERAVATPGE
jgi:hypothetical protein